MGLDMFGYISKDKPTSLKDNTAAVEIEGELSLQWQWRKENALHGFFEEIYDSRGGNQCFNSIAIEVFEEDLLCLIELCNEKELKPVEGFFFGNTNEVTEEQYQSYIDFAKEAISFIHQGYHIIYDSWW